VTGRVDRQPPIRRFIGSFVRPNGLDVPATPVFVEAVAGLAALARPLPAREALAGRVMRLPMFAAAVAARQLADDRPLWAYLLRPLLATYVAVSAAAYRLSAVTRSLSRRMRMLRKRTVQRFHESSRRLTNRGRRANKTVARAVRGAGSVARKVVKGA
jgi:hypothetical protein